MDALSLKTTGDFIESFMTRTSGKARGIAILGSYTDLGIFTRHEDIRVVVICTDLILRNSSKIDDLKSVYEAVFPGECVKNRVVCASCLLVTLTSVLCLKMDALVLFLALAVTGIVRWSSS